MRQLYRISARIAVLILTVCALLCGCGNTELLFKELTAEEVQKWEIGDAVTQTPDMLGLSAMRKIAANGGYTLYFNDRTTEIAVASDNGTVWYSNPQDRLSLDRSSLGRYSSPILVYAIDSTETVKLMNTMDDCVAYGQASAENIENGVRVTYRFGKVTKSPIYPQVLTAERFDEILKTLDSSEQNNMKRYYVEVNYSTVTDAQTLKKLKEMYSNIESLERIYSLKSSVSALETKRLVSYFEKAGYTYEDRERDHQRVGYTEEDKSYGNFILPVEYTLTEGRLNVKIDADGIRSTANMKIESVTVLPYLNTPGGAQSCKAIMTDGSGAVIDLGKIRFSGTDEYYENVYGQNYSLFRNNNTSDKYKLSFPMYGILTDEGAVLAVAENGDATAAVTASPKISETGRGSVGFRFKYTDYAQVKLTSTDTDTVNSYAEKSVNDTASVSYTFIDNGSSWTDIALAYRKSLEDGNMLPKENSAGISAVVRVIGAIDDKAPIAGIPREVIRPLTSFEQAASIAEELKSSLGSVPLVMRYSGWQKGGVRSYAQVSVKAEKKLGESRGLEELNKTLKDLGVKLYPDADIQYVYRDSFGDGFSRKKDTAKFITREYAYKPQYNIANFLPENGGLNAYILRSGAIEKNFIKFMKSAQTTDFSAFCLPYIASDLSSDYSRNSFETRNASRANIQKVLKQLNGKYKVMSEGANAYSLFCMDWAVNLPTESNRHAMIDESIPLIQMVLSGKIAYTASEFNDFNDDRHYILKCIETGSSPYFTVMHAENSAVKETEYDNWYSANFAGLKNRMVSAADEIYSALAPIIGSAMCDYKVLGDGVVQINYENGTAIAVNYTGKPFDTPFGRVDAGGWLSGKWR